MQSQDLAPANAGLELKFLWLELTRKCNLECVHCYTDSSPARDLYETLGADDWKRALREAATLDCRSVQFIGGEPTLHPELPDLIDLARDLGFEFIEVYTNGVSIGPRLKKHLVDNSVALAFSVYANAAAAHDAVTRRAGSFERTLKSIRWALDAGLDVRCGVIATPANAAATLFAERFLRELGIGDIRVDVQRPVGRGQSEETCDALDGLCGHCADGRLCVTASGALHPCVFSRFAEVGRASEGLAVAVAGLSMGLFRDAIQERLRKPRAFAQCVPFGDPCSPEEGHPCAPLGGRRCIPEGGECSPNVPPCNPEGACSPSTR
jgi:molybdenum cofactor biosynthesis enzyme MoaA